MASPGFATNIDSTYADSSADASIKIHQQAHDGYASYLNKLDTAFLTPSNGNIPIYDSGTGTFKPGAITATTDRVLFVSKAGSDSNDGRSWPSAFLTIAAALTALGTNPGTIWVGAGTFVETAPLTFSSSNQSQVVRGVGMYGTFIQLGSNGTLWSQVNKNGGELHDLSLAFGAGITGTLLKLDNAFRFLCSNVRFDGDVTSGQTGLWMNNNAGDSHFYRCKFESLNIGILSETSINWFIGGLVTTCTTGVKSGDPTGVIAIGGMHMTGITFSGAGTYYVDIDGLGLAYVFDNCWFDGTATTAVKVGSADGAQGPRMFALTNCPSLFGATTSLLLYKATRVYLDNVKFHNGGTTPTELSIPNPANVAEGHIHGVRSNQGAFIETLVPSTWEGYRGYVSPTTKVKCIETTVYNDLESDTYKKVMIRVNGRISGDASTTVTFPTAFATTQFVKSADSTGFAGMTLSASSLIIPTGVTGSGVIIIEGW